MIQSVNGFDGQIDQVDSSQGIYKNKNRKRVDGSKRDENKLWNGVMALSSSSCKHIPSSVARTCEETLPFFCSSLARFLELVSLCDPDG